MSYPSLRRTPLKKNIFMNAEGTEDRFDLARKQVPSVWDVINRVLPGKIYSKLYLMPLDRMDQCQAVLYDWIAHRNPGRFAGSLTGKRGCPMLLHGG